MEKLMTILTTVGATRKPLIWWIAVIMTIPFAVQAQNKYVGAQKCATCHNTDKQGDAFHVWQTSAHAGAFRTLTSMSADKNERNGLWIIKMGRGDQYGLPTPPKNQSIAYRVTRRHLAPTHNSLPRLLI